VNEHLSKLLGGLGTLEQSHDNPVVLGGKTGGNLEKYNPQGVEVYQVVVGLVVQYLWSTVDHRPSSRRESVKVFLLSFANAKVSNLYNSFVEVFRSNRPDVDIWRK